MCFRMSGRMNQSNQETDLLQIRQIKKYIDQTDALGTKRDVVRALDGVSFSVKRGEAFGVVGETGSGKSTLARLITRLIDPTSGDILYNGKSIIGLKGKNLKEYRKKVQMVFQNPYGSLDPRQKVGDSLKEAMYANNTCEKSELEKRTIELLTLVGLNSEHANRYPHELSGGQRQRLAISRALCLEPEMIVLDEPTSFLDVSIQAQILELLNDLRVKLNLTYIFISHNLSVIWYMCGNVVVMQSGKIVESGDRDRIFRNPQNEYTKELIQSIPTALD